MSSNHENVQLFAKAALDTFNLKQFSIDKEKALVGLKDDIGSEFEDLNAKETKKARCDHFKVTGAKPKGYEEKVLFLDSGKSVIYGIRHMGGNPDLPFIQFTPNYPISSKAEALEVYEKVGHEFLVFKPKYLSFWSRDEIDADFLGSTFMVSTSNEMKNLNEWPLERDLKFTKITDDSYYEWYENGYKEFHESSPELREKVTVNSVDSMRDSMQEGLLYFVELNGQRMGLIAGEKSKLLGHDGLYFHEIYISKKWKGKGVAKAIQRKFVASKTAGHEFVWGTIDSHNLPSYKTAKSNGRIPIRFECFINIVSK